jgi:hypothetical protein
MLLQCGWYRPEVGLLSHEHFLDCPFQGSSMLSNEKFTDSYAMWPLNPRGTPKGPVPEGDRMHWILIPFPPPPPVHTTECSYLSCPDHWGLFCRVQSMILIPAVFCTLNPHSLVFSPLSPHSPRVQFTISCFPPVSCSVHYFLMSSHWIVVVSMSMPKKSQVNLCWVPWNYHPQYIQVPS